MKKTIKLEKIVDAIRFVKLAGKVNGSVSLSNNNGYKTDGKSLLGVFDIAANSVMDVEYPEDANADFDRFLQQLEFASANFISDVN